MLEGPSRLLHERSGSHCVYQANPILVAALSPRLLLSSESQCRCLYPQGLARCRPECSDPDKALCRGRFPSPEEVRVVYLCGPQIQSFRVLGSKVGFWCGTLWPQSDRYQGPSVPETQMCLSTARSQDQSFLPAASGDCLYLLLKCVS